MSKYLPFVSLASRVEAGAFLLVCCVALPLARGERVACPEVDWDLSYRFKGSQGKIQRCFEIDRDKTFALFYKKLKLLDQ